MLENLWQQEGLVFTATVDFDMDSTSLFLTPEKVSLINRRLAGTHVDRTDAYTLPTCNVAITYVFPGC